MYRGTGFHVYMGISVSIVDALAAILVFASMWRVFRYRELLYTCDVQSWMVYGAYHSSSAAALTTPQSMLLFLFTLIITSMVLFWIF